MKIAVTGGIGSGKSTLLNAFKEMGYPCFSCDEIYNAVFRSEDYKNSLIRILGENILTDGKLDRKKISAIVFSDKEKLAALNAVAHPLIMDSLYRQMNKYPLSFAEVPLLFEGNRQGDFDRVIIVYRDKNARILSVMARDRCTRAEAEKRVASQVNYEELLHSGYTVIYNDGDALSLKKKAEEFIENL